jgi:hypothetical protein
MEPANKKQRRCEALSYPPEVIAEVAELRLQLADRDQLVCQLQAQLAECHERIASHEAALNANAREDEESIAHSDNEDDSSTNRFPGLPPWARPKCEGIVEKLQPGRWPKDEGLDIPWEVVPYIIENIHSFCGLLRGNAAIRWAWFDLDSQVFSHVDPALYHECMTKLGEALGTLEALEELELVEFADFATAASIVKETRKIRALELRAAGKREVDPEKERDSAELMADALRDHPSLEDFILENETSLEAGVIAAALRTTSKLRKVHFDGWRNERVQPVGLEALSHILRIETLHEATFAYFTISESGLHAIAECLANGSLLSSLRFRSCIFPESYAAADLVVAAVKRNFVLEELDDFRSWEPERLADPNQTSVLKAITRLNKAGRRYMAEDQPSKESGVQVLSNVMEESYPDLEVLDCLFLFICRKIPAFACVSYSDASTEGQEEQGARVDEEGSQIAMCVYLW